jgi:hypothetical protein
MGGTIEVEARRYSWVRVSGGDGREVEFEVNAPSLSRAEVRALRAAVEIDAGRDGWVRVRAVGPRRRRERALFGLIRRTVRPFAELRLTVPRGFAVRLGASDASAAIDAVEGGVVARASAGSLTFHGVSGGIRARVRGGHLRTGECRGAQDLRVSGGSILVWNAEGEIDARTSGGFVVVDQVRGDVRAHASGGMIRVDQVSGRLDASVSGGALIVRQRRPPGGEHDLRCSAGELVLQLPPDAAGELVAEGRPGRVVARLNGHHEEIDGVLRRRLGAGGPRLGLVARGGDVFVTSGDHS